MTDRRLVPVILSGGAGSRLWPASRTTTPKQLLPLVDERTMFLMTVQRTDPLPNAGAPVVVCNEAQRPGIEQELAKTEHADASLILEPTGRNTAPAVAAAALHLVADGSDPILFVMPADHVIRDEVAFAAAITLASEFAERGYLLTFGIDPASAETGYGYIRFGAPLAEGVRIVEAFKEKPDAPTATEYLATGRYLWNSGMFMFRASRFLAELEAYAPEVLAAARMAVQNGIRDGNALLLDETAFSASPAISIDYAVMEHTASAAVVPIHTGWSDVGSWAALWELGQADEAGNVLTGDVELVDVHNSYVRAGSRLVGVIGLDDVVVVDTPDAVLVTRRDRSQDVKTIVDRLKESGRSEADTDGTEAHPWGNTATLAATPTCRVMRLEIGPGASAPASFDRHQSVHWIVVEGTAVVRTEGTESRLTQGLAATVAPGAEHRVENESVSEVLKIIAITVDIGVNEDTRE